MRKNYWLRYGLGALVASATVMSGLLIACGDDDNVTTTTKPDAATAADTGTTTPDGSPPGDSGPKPPQTPPAKIQIVNAATDLGAVADLGGNNLVRICFASSGVVVTAPPLPNAGTDTVPAGIPIGLGGAVPSFGLPLDTIAITPYVMNAKTLFGKKNYKGTGGTEVSCDKLVGAGAPAGAATENVDFWKLQDIPAGTLKSGKSYALVLSGCAANSTITPAKCGAGFTAGANPGVGNLKVTVYELDNATTVPGTSIGVQFIHAAAASDPFLANALGAGVRLPIVPGIAESDGGLAVSEFRKIGTATAVAVGEATSPATLMQGVTLASEIAPNVAAYSAAPFRPTALRLSTVAALSYPNPAGGSPLIPDGGDYRNGASFVFIAVGDLTAAPIVDLAGNPADAGGTNRFNTRSFHYLGFPTNPNIARFE
jgi:hypothetical protein